MNIENTSKSASTHNQRSNRWLRSVLTSIVAATVIRWGIVENFKIPTCSMEKTLLAGDIVIVSKLHYGPRLPITPLQIPLTHQSIGGVYKTFSNYIQLPYFRLPGFSKIQRGDKVVFNGVREQNMPIDIKTFYIKRCIGLPGDTLQIKDGLIYINNVLLKDSNTVLYKYYTRSSIPLNSKFFQQNNVDDYTIDDYSDVDIGYYMTTTADNALRIKKQNDFIIEIKKFIMPQNFSLPDFLGYPNKRWNLDFMGPVTIPKKGFIININEDTLAIYGDLIIQHENNKNVAIRNNKLYTDGKLTYSYKFKYNYYFMRGDNVHNSSDSRIIGFIPETHIVGKAISVLFSIDPHSKAIFFKRIRWNRMFRNYD